jgi:hypothetical protein
MASSVKYSPPTSPGAELYNGGRQAGNPLGGAFSPLTSRSMTSPPLSPSADRPQSPTPRMTANAKRYKYLRRILKFRQMDFEYAFWQMLYLLIAPQKVYRNFGYRKQTKDQWARDDPAFLVLLAVCLCVSSVGFVIVLGLHFIDFIKFILWVVFIDCIGVGLLIATILWLITNRYFIVQPPRGQDVEWGYCFDIHLNAFFPLLMILHFFQLPFLNAFIIHDTFISCIIGNTLWLVAIGYYIYITFLGYSSLPFLKRTHLLLYPLTCLFIIYILTVALRLNLTQTLCTFYQLRL